MLHRTQITDVYMRESKTKLQVRLRKKTMRPHDKARTYIRNDAICPRSIEDNIQ